MERVVIHAKCTEGIGAIRRQNGLNNSAPLQMNRHPQANLVESLKALKIPRTRFHDAALADPGFQLVDISRVFPIWTADIDNPDNYIFADTDDCFAQCLATGSKLEYRLGESIEHTLRQYRVNPPADYQRWADICIHIIRHYNEGWANGFHHNIEYWSIWEEPDTIPQLWTGTFEDYLELYAVVAKSIKKAFPNLKVGGPQTCCDMNRLERFIAHCRQNDVPLDFCAWTTYVRDPEQLGVFIEQTRALLDKHDFAHTEVNIAEWHYGPESWAIHGETTDAAVRMFEEVGGIHSAVFTAYALSLFQDTPLDMGYYYSTTGYCWGLFTEIRRPNKNYYALKAFADMADCSERIAATPRPHPAVRVLGGRHADGRITLLVSCFKAQSMEIAIDTGEFKWTDSTVRVLDERHDLTKGDEPVHKEGTILSIRKESVGSAVYLVTLS